MRKRVLVVEDFGSLRSFLCSALTQKGYETVPAANAVEAWTILSRSMFKFDLVLTDYLMPYGTGYDLLIKIKNDPTTQHIPVVFLTSESNPATIELATEAGLSAWITKPYHPENFFIQLSNILEDHTWASC